MDKCVDIRLRRTMDNAEKDRTSACKYVIDSEELINVALMWATERIETSWLRHVHCLKMYDG